MAAISFKCPNCDGELIFDPATQKYKCEYCDSLFSQEELDSMKPATEEEKIQPEGMEQGTQQSQGEPGASQEDAVIYNCPSCGAEILTDATTAATFCYYCHNPVVLGGRLKGEYMPNKIIPFEVTKEAAIKGFENYLGKRKFVPKAFYSRKQIESITGVYFPYWLYNVELDGKLQGDARNVRVWRSGDVQYTETKHYAIAREGDVKLSNLTENALQKANAKLAQSVMPYAYDKMKDFNMGYLSGFMAERRDIGREHVQGKMQAEMRASAEKLMRDTVTGYSSVAVRNMFFQPKKEEFHYVLFPVWTITYKAHNGKVYFYSMNGQTGKICGELPIDYRKLTLVSVVAAALVLAAGLIGGYWV